MHTPAAGHAHTAAPSPWKHRQDALRASWKTKCTHKYSDKWVQQGWVLPVRQCLSPGLGAAAGPASERSAGSGCSSSEHAGSVQPTRKREGWICCKTALWTKMGEDWCKRWGDDIADCCIANKWSEMKIESHFLLACSVRRVHIPHPHFQAYFIFHIIVTNFDMFCLPPF